MGPIGVQEMVFIFILALLLFGPKKLPELGRMLGKGLREFRKAKDELKNTFDSHMRELERETQVDSGWRNESSSSYSPVPYKYPYDEDGRHETSPSSSSTSQQPPSLPERSTSEGTVGNAGNEAGDQRSLPQITAASESVPRSNGFHSNTAVSSHEDGAA